MWHQSQSPGQGHWNNSISNQMCAWSREWSWSFYSSGALHGLEQGREKGSRNHQQSLIKKALVTASMAQVWLVEEVIKNGAVLVAVSSMVDVESYDAKEVIH